MSTEGYTKSVPGANEPNAKQAAINAAVMKLIGGAKVVSDADAIPWKASDLEAVTRVKLSNIGSQHALIKSVITPTSANAETVWHGIAANGSVELKFERRILSNYKEFTTYIRYVAVDDPNLAGEDAKKKWNEIVGDLEYHLPPVIISIFIANQ